MRSTPSPLLHVAAVAAGLTAASCGSDSPPRNTESGSASGLVATSITATPGASASAAPAAPLTRIDKARSVVEKLARRDYAAVRAALTKEAQAQLDEAALQTGWEAAVGALGAFSAIESSRSDKRGDKEQITVVARLEKGTVEVAVGFVGPSDEIAMLKPSKVEASWSPPPYADAQKFEVRAIEVGRGDKALPGLLVMPKGEGPFPVVVLVHGSGGGDRDESMGAARPFRDLAEGLAARGVAVLRWDKRTSSARFVAALAMPTTDITVKEEYLDDVAAAIALVQKAPAIDPKRVFVAGHSEGGWLTPWLLRDHPDLAGGILLAGNARHFADVLPDQYEYIATLDDGAVTPLERMQIDAVRKQCERARDPKLPLTTPASELPLGVAPKYWLSIQAYDAVATAKPLPQPLFILQGGRDYQVTAKEDLALWQKGLADEPNVETKLYPDLNHAFIAGTGMATPGEYLALSGHVEQAVVEDLAAWVAKH